MLPASAFADGWVYTQSNDPTPGQNSVLALHYGHSGGLNPADIRQFPTGGTGARFLAAASGAMGVGTEAGDQEVQLSSDRRLLFAVNEGSNSIAVFHVDHATGALTAVKGSPFSSGGIAPISIGYSRGRIVVANHGQTAPFDFVHAMPGPASFVSFSVSKSGRLKQLSTLAEGPAGLTDAAMSPDGRDVFSTGFYTLKDIETATLSPAGRLAAGSGSPFQFPAIVTAGAMPPFFIPPPIIPVPFGIGVNPVRPYVYVLAPGSNHAVVYRYTHDGALTFVGQATDTGGIAACWAVVSKDGRHMYLGDSFTQNVSLMDISADGSKLSLGQSAPLESKGTTLNVALDPKNRFLYAIGAHDDEDAPRVEGVNFATMAITDAPADGNFVEAWRIGAGGRLTHLSTTALPVPLSDLTHGLAVISTP